MKEIWHKSGKGNKVTFSSKTPERKITVTFNFKFKEIEVFHKDFNTDKEIHFLCYSVGQCNEILRRNNIKLFIPNDLQY